ncbi:hypothetical protein T4B_14786 [Trichinella pseudospiralis]|uniref:Uncharacterized protein n=1 Tax=Trichinella pseudospiralis TaxID=6337 RepID=A0A0V1IMK7_TRIPS|nr:hypothetical protein T4B_14786 [Trichinella pseudospiralis]
MPFGSYDGYNRSSSSTNYKAKVRRDDCADFAMLENAVSYFDEGQKNAVFTNVRMWTLFIAKHYVL